MTIGTYRIGSRRKRGEGLRVGTVRFLPSGTDSRQVIRLIARASLRTPISVGCYCADETRCHRSVLLKLIRKAQRAR